MSQIQTVFMFANYTPSDGSIGITKKIRSEIQTLRKQGMSVVYTAYEKDGIAIFDNADVCIYKKPYPTKIEKIDRKLRYATLEKTAVSFLKQYEGSFDLGYIRLGPPNGKLFAILKQLKQKGAVLIAEALAYFPGIQYKSLGGKYIILMHRLNGHKFKNYLSFFLTEGNLTSLHGVPTYSMSIGVEVDNIKPHAYVGATDELHMISVANENVYHAYDRIIESLHHHLQNKPNDKIYVHLVGTVSEQTKSLYEQYHLQNHLFLYGKKSGDELDAIYNRCNVGLGPFGQHRVGGKKDTGLKTKEYFAKGLPYVFSGEEPTVPEDYPYICVFPSDESMIDFDRVRAFYESYREDGQVIERMRTFAHENYSWDRIMREALSHLDEQK